MKNKTYKYQQGGELGSTLGSIGGMALGSFIAPGIGTSIGGMLGSKAGNFVQNQFMNGGKLIQAKGLEHSEGGIQLSNNNEIENGETIINDFVFSNNLPYNKKQTFANKSKSIDKKYFRDNDKIDAMGKKLELEKLSNQQENMKKSLMLSDITNKYMCGGKLKKKYAKGGYLNNFDPNNPLSDTRANALLMNDLRFNNAMVPDNGVINLDGSTEPIFSNPTVSSGSGLIQPTFNNNNNINTPNIPITSNVTDNQSINPISNKPNYGNIIPQLAGDAYNILQGVKGGDPVDFQRVNPYLANPNPAITGFNNTTSTTFNNAKNAIRNSATSSGEYLAQMNSLTGKEGITRGMGRAGIKSDYNKINTGIVNQTGSQNAGIQMQEAIARQQETDAARSAVSKGLSDMSSKIGSINNEKSSRNNQKDLVSLMSRNGYKLTRDGNGEMIWEKNGTYVPYEVGIKSVFNQ